MAKFRLINSIVLFLLFIYLHPAQSEMLSPKETIQQSNEEILSLYRLEKDNNENISTEIFSIMDRVTDFTTMAETTLQAVCPPSGNSTCRVIQTEFIELLKLSATTKLGRYMADRFEYLEEEITKQTSMVKTIAYFKEDCVSLNYVLKKSGDNWLIINYIVDEIDTVRNYQKQFQRITRKGSLETLLSRLKKRNSQYRKTSQTQ